MKTLVFKTNLHCGKCIAKITPALDGDSRIVDWQADTAHASKLLTVTGEGIDTSEVVSLLAGAGFKAEELTGTTEAVSEASACSLEMAEEKPASAFSLKFWLDNAVWKRASANTFTCLIGCSIGDFGTMIFLQAYYHHEMSMFTMMGIAMAMGLLTSILLEAAILRVKEKFSIAQAFRVAFSMSFMSMLAMELAENATDYLLTGGGNVPLTDWFYWFALLVALGAGFFVPLPYNYYKLKKFNKACH